MEYGGFMTLLNLYAFILLIAIVFASFTVHKRGFYSCNKAIYTVCMLLILFNIFRYLYFPISGKGFHLPVEYSAVAYFSVPVIVLFKINKLLCWAAYSGIIAGFFYYGAMVFAGGSIFGHYPLFIVLASMLCHGALMFCGTILLLNRKFSQKDTQLLMLGNAFVFLWALLLRPFACRDERYFIYLLLDASFLKDFTVRLPTVTVFCAYYLFISFLLFISAKLFIYFNTHFSK